MTAGLNPRYTFGTFVVGPANQLAVSAARAVAEAPGTAYNPLVIHGGPGLGKTHLVMAIGQLANMLTPASTVTYLSLEEFQEAFQAAAAAGQTEAFRNRFSQVDFLLLDDVQYLSRRTDLQSELSRVLTQLQQSGKQVVLTGTKAPSEIEDLDDQLRANLAGGLVVDIGLPEFQTRIAVLEQRARERGAELAADVVETLARLEVSSIRELLGYLNRVVALQAVSEQALNADMVQALVAGEGAALAAVGGGTPMPVGAGAAPSRDEFAAFLSDVTEAVEHQVEQWRTRLEAGIERWQQEGYRTARLEQLLLQDVSVAVDQALREFERDVKRLRSLAGVMQTVDPARVEDPAFTDPDRVAEAEALVQEATKHQVPPPAPSAAWRFETYVEGEANRAALQAARVALEAPGVERPLVVLVGPSGVGKTHLLHAIGNALAAKPSAMVACFSAQQFEDELEDALEGDRLGIWLSRYQPVTAFLLDDVQLLAGKERPQEELAHLIAQFRASHRQVVVTLTTAPRVSEGLGGELAALLEMGQVVAIGTPDRELRRAIVARKLKERHGEVSDDLADYLAARSADGIRAVVGMVQRVLDTAETRGVSPSVSLARELVEGAQPVRPRPTGMRTSGVIASPRGGVTSREKMVWTWPDPGERAIEEMY